MKKKLLIGAIAIILVALVIYSGTETENLKIYSPNTGEELEELEAYDYTPELKKAIDTQDRKYSIIKGINYLTVATAFVFMIKLLFIDFEIIKFSKKLILTFIYFLSIYATVESFGNASFASSCVYRFGITEVSYGEIIIPEIIAVLLILTAIYLHYVFNKRVQTELIKTYEKKTTDKWKNLWRS